MQASAIKTNLDPSSFIPPLKRTTLTHSSEGIPLPSAHIHPPAGIPSSVKSICSKAELTFFELTRRMFKDGSDFVNHSIKSVLIAKLDTFHDRKGDLDTLLIAMKEGDIFHPAFNDLDDMSYLALWGVKEGHMDDIAFANLMAVRVGLIYYKELTIVPIFIDGNINPEAVEIVAETCQLRNDKTKSFLTLSEITTVLTEQQFSSFPFILYGKEKVPSSFSISTYISDEIDVNVLNRLRSKDSTIIPSVDLVQSVVSVRTNNPGFKVQPVIGPTSYSEVGNCAYLRNRILMVTFPKYGPPNNPHHIHAYGDDFRKHDIYHALVSSSAEQQVMLALMYMGNILSIMDLPLDLQETQVSLKKMFYDLEIRVAMREVRKYPKDPSLDGLKLISDFISQKMRAVEFYCESNRAREKNNYFLVLSALFRKLLEMKREGVDWDEELQLDFLKILSLKPRRVITNNRSFLNGERQILEKEEMDPVCVLENALLNSGLIHFLKSSMPAYIDPKQETYDLELLDCSPFNLGLCNSFLLDSDILMDEIVQREGRVLKYASLKVRSNKKLVRKAIISYGNALKYASPELQDDFELARLASPTYSLTPSTLQFVSRRLRAIPEITQLYTVNSEENSFVLKESPRPSLPKTSAEAERIDRIPIMSKTKVLLKNETVFDNYQQLYKNHLRINEQIFHESTNALIKDVDKYLKINISDGDTIKFLKKFPQYFPELTNAQLGEEK